MCEYIKAFSSYLLYTALRPHFTDASARGWAHSGIDEVTFP